MSAISFEKMKMLERHARVNSPLMQLFNERWASVTPDDKDYREVSTRIQTISQELLNLITKRLL
jgi:hypothetical protein